MKNNEKPWFPQELCFSNSLNLIHSHDLAKKHSQFFLKKKITGAKANEQAEYSTVRLQMPSNDKKATWDATVFNEENCPGISANHKLLH